MKYIDEPAPKTAREIFLEWFDAPTCWLEWTALYDFDLDGNDVCFTTLTIRNFAHEYIVFEDAGDNEDAQVWSEGGNVRVNLPRGSKLIHGNGIQSLDKARLSRTLGCTCSPTDTAALLADDRFLKIFTPIEWPRHLARALGK